MPRRILQILTVLLVVLWMTIIFCFSAQPATTSTEMSIHAGQLFGHFFVPGYDSWSEEDQLAFAAKIDHPVRKCAHASEYALLAVLWLACFASFKKPLRKTWYLAWILTTLYACTDEFHQLFVEGRSGQVTDVMIDSGGAAFGVLVILLGGLILHAITGRRKHRS